jgi:tetratricopeptide (TPR) repeat protein
MMTKFSKFADVFMESLWLLALVLAPMFFNVYSQRVFEPDKISLIRTLALFGLVAGVLKLAETWGMARAQTPAPSPWWRTPLVWPVLALMAAYLLSTALSVTPRQSFWGSYQRLQGTFTMLSYMVLFFIIFNTLRRPQQWQRLQYTIILVSLPIALYGVVQHYHLDPLPWGGDTTKRVAANMGNSIFLAAYLIMAVPLTLERLMQAIRTMLLDEQGSMTDALAAGALFFILVIQGLAILFTQSRGPWIGLAMGLYVFGLLVLTSLRQKTGGNQQITGREFLLGVGMGLVGLAALGGGLAAMTQLSGLVGGLLVLVGIVAALGLYLIPLFRKQGWRWLWLSFITQSLAVIVMIVMLNLSPTFIPGFRTIPYVGRLAQLMDSEHGTGQVRVLIWQGAVDMMLRPHGPLTFPDGHTDALNSVRPLIGYGPESMWVAYNRFYRPELGELEHRNASPDRSHNETFDSLVTTGFLGFLAYFALFFSIFYYSLHWLGLIGDKVSRYLFFVLGISGAVLGVLIPWLRGIPEFLGVGLPLGFILGILIYITYAAFRGSESITALERRHMLIIAIFATLVAHFVEIHFGIAIVATRTYFFILVAALAVLGQDKLALAALPAAPTPAPAPVSKRKGKSKKHRERRSSVAASRTGQKRSLTQIMLPYAIIMAAIMLVMSWDFVSNQTNISSPVGIFIKSWFIHLNHGTPVAGPGVLTLMLFTLVVGLVLALNETWRPAFSGGDTLKSLLVALSLILAAWFIGGLIIAARLVPQSASTPAMQQAARIANNITIFYLLMAATALMLMASLWTADTRPSRILAHRPLLSGLGATAFLILALVITGKVNLNLVRSDIYFKIGQGADAAGDWNTSRVFYEKAAEIAPKEDYYRLFQGRSFLESGRKAQDANQRNVLFQRAEEILMLARKLNPLNTDHSSNLGRFYHTKSSYVSDPEERRALLEKSSENYRIATMLSPNAAHLKNEWANTYIQLGDLDQARQLFNESLAIDPDYTDTYRRMAQMELEAQNWEEAYRHFQKVAEKAPKDPLAYSGMAYALSKMGRTDEAIEANKQVLALRPTDISTLQNLALLYHQQGKDEIALSYAQKALQIAPEEQRPGLQGLIGQIKQALTP